MNKPSVSVLMSTYNGAVYLRQAINSILNQTFTDFEFIIVDDNSTDNSGEILRSYNDPRIRIIQNNKNIGLTKSLNKGLKEAQGKYIARMDADDVSLLDRLKEQYNFLEAHPTIALVGSWAESMDEYGIVTEIRKVPTDPETIRFELVLRNCFFHSSVCFRREAVKKVGGYDATYRHAQDYELFSRLADIYPLTNISRSLIQLRSHKKSTVGNSYSQKIVRDNALKIILNNIRKYTNINESEFNVLKRGLIVRELDSSSTFLNLLTTLSLNHKIWKEYMRKTGESGREKIIGRYRSRRNQILRRYLAVKYAFIKKITPYNVFVKLPSILKNRIKEKIRGKFMRIFLFRNNPIILTDKYGTRFVLYPWDRTPIETLLTRQIFDIEFRALSKLVRKNSVVFDIGAHIGLHSVMFGRWSGTSGVVHAFEPVPQIYNLLRETIALNRMHHVTPHNLGFMNKASNMEMNIFEDTNSSWNSFGNPVFNGISAKKRIWVATDTIDNFCKRNNFKKINFMKVDVEGFEKKVFEGAQHMLKNGLIDCLSFEISQIPLSGNNAKAKEIFDVLSSFGYKAYRFNPSTDRFEGPYEDSKEFHENYYASRRDLTK